MKVNQLITLTNGTPVQIASAANGPVPANKIYIQMSAGNGTHVGYLLQSEQNGVSHPAIGTPADVIAELAPATATVPGLPYIETNSSQSPDDIDVSKLWVDGTTDEKVRVSYEPRI